MTFGCFQASGWLLACLGGAAAHTAYKCALFALPDVAVRADLLALGVATFIVGMLFALLREAFGSVLFPVLAHVAFDALSYADLDSIPWWVW